jgi:ElaB/YqjD/DUF883 family membrane-anchored ribosome-binding protein
LWTVLLADLEREQQLLQTATEVWQTHHQRLVQEADQIRQRHEQELHSAAVNFHSRQAAMLAELAEARSKLESLVNDNARLQTAQASSGAVLYSQRCMSSLLQDCLVVYWYNALLGCGWTMIAYHPYKRSERSAHESIWRV